MPSPESRAIRATFVRAADAPEVSPAVMRQEWEAAVADTPLPPTIAITPVSIDGIYGEWVASADTPDHQVLLFLHGGGFNAGSCLTHRELAARLCLASNVRVLLVAYRLAPEHPFPAGLHDAGAAYRWLLEQGFRPEQIVVGGDSAGGGLAAATLLWARSEGLPQPAAAVLLSPWLDLTLSGPSITANAEVDPLTTLRGLQRAANWYVGQADPAEPLVSPIYGELAELPPLLIQVGGHEILLSDATRFAERARAADVSVSLEIWDEMWHVWQAFAANLPEGRAAIEQIGQFIRKQLEEAGQETDE